MQGPKQGAKSQSISSKNTIRETHRIDNRVNNIQPIVIPDEDEEDKLQEANVSRESNEHVDDQSDSDVSMDPDMESEAIRIRLLEKRKELLHIKKLQAEVEMEEVKLQVAKQERDEKKVIVMYL